MAVKEGYWDRQARLLMEKIVELCDSHGVYVYKDGSGWGWFYPDTRREVTALSRAKAVQSTMKYAMSESVFLMWRTYRRIKRLARWAETSWAVYDRAEALALASARIEALREWVKIDEEHPILAKLASAETADEVRVIVETERRKPVIEEEWKRKERLLEDLKKGLERDKSYRSRREYTPYEVLRMLELGH